MIDSREHIIQLCGKPDLITYRTITMLSYFRVLLLLSVFSFFVFAQDINNDGDTPLALPGDLFKGITSPNGQLVADIILGKQPAISLTKGTRPLGLKCFSDPCCKWYSVSDALTLMFKGITGRCNDNARAAIRLGFHDGTIKFMNVSLTI